MSMGRLLQSGAGGGRNSNRRGEAGVYTLGTKMRSLLKPLPMSLKESPAGLIVDLGILAMFLVLLAVR
jgi:hypothetical protein